MVCRQCEGIERQFDAREAQAKLEEFRRQGPRGTTKRLIEALRDGGVTGDAVLDIGGGVGAVTLGLLEAGAARAVQVDASRAYIEAAREEAARRGVAERVRYRHGDFVALAEDLEAADIVTLDRVICCYHDMPALVGRSLEKAREVYALVYPRDRWWVRLGIALMNFGLWLVRDPFRTFAHREREIEALIESRGFRARFRENTLVWQVVVYARS